LNVSDEPTTSPSESPVPEPPAAPEPPAPEPSEAVSVPKASKDPYIWGTGRRKTAVARVRIRPGEGKFMVNKVEVDRFFCLHKDLQAVRQPLSVTDTSKSFDVFVNVSGGGTSGQAGAIVLGLARALLKANKGYEPKLREFNLLTRDPRKVERKKYGQRGARRRFQFSKR
jgi:small subunit ribosomal protein S9